MAESPVQGNPCKVRPGLPKEVPSSSSPEASLTWCLSHLCKPAPIAEDQREGTVDTDTGGGGEMDKRRKASQWRALVAIRTQHVKGGSTGIARFRTRGGLKLLLELLKYPECSRKILDLALSILANCCTELETRVEVRKLGGITVVVDILKRNVAMETVQNRAARALGNLSMDPESAALIHSAGGVPLLLLCVSLSSAPSSPTAAPNQAPCPKMECAQSAARALLYLADTPSNRLSLLVQGTLTALAPLIAPEYPQGLRRAALRTLHELSRGCGLECAREVSRSGVLAQLGVMASGESGKPFEELALKTLANMCSQGCLRPFVGSLGVIQKFTEEVKRDPLKSGVFLKALCLCCKEAVNRAKVKESGGLEVLIGFLAAHQSHPLSRLAILACVDFVYDESALEQLQELGLVPLLVARLVELAKGEEPSAEKMDVSITSNMSASELLPSCYDSFDFPPPEGSRKEDKELGSSSFLSLRSWLVSEGLISSEGELLDSPGGVEGEWGSLQIPPSSSPLLPPSPNADTNSVTCASPSHPLPISTPKQVALPAPVSSPAQPQLSPPRRTTVLSTSTPQPSSTSTPQPSSSSTPQPSSTSTPQPSSSSTPQPLSTSTPQPSSSSTPQPSSSSTPQPSSASTPQPSSASTPQPSSTSTPQPSSTSTPHPSSTPQPSSTSTPQPSSASTPQPSSTSTPQPSSSSTPQPSSASTPQPSSTSTPQPSSTSTPHPSSTSTPQPSSSAQVPQIQLNSPSFLSSPATSPQVPVSPSKFSSPQRKRPRVHPAARGLAKITLDAPPSLPRVQPYHHPYHPEPWAPESPILLLLSRFSHSTDPSTALVNSGVMSGLLFYLTRHRDPSGRCFRMLCRLSCNPNCLQALVRTGSVALIRQRLCQRGGRPARGERQTDRVKAKVKQLGLALLNNLRVQCESGFGSGVLTHVMLSGSEADKLSCALSLPLVNSNKALLKKLLLDSGGLLLALQPLGCDEDDNEGDHTRLLSDWFNSPQIVPAPQLHSLYFSLLIGCLSSLMNGFKAALDKSRPRTLSSVKTLSFDQASTSSPPPLKRPRLANLCPYSDSAFDLHFQLDDGTQVSANRRAVADVEEGTNAAGSEYFRALLGGGFGEARGSAGEAIPIKEVSRGMLLPVLHYLHGCRLTQDAADAGKHDGDEAEAGGRCLLLESLAPEGLRVHRGETTGERVVEAPAFQKTPLGEMMIGASRFLVTALREEAEDLCVSLLLSSSTKPAGPPASTLAEDKGEHGGPEESADECLAKRTSGLELSGVEAESVTPNVKRPPASGPVRKASRAVHSTLDLKTNPVSRPSCMSTMDKSFHPEESRPTSKSSVKPGSQHGQDSSSAPGGWSPSSLLPQVYWFSQRYSYPGLGKACLSLLLGSQESPGAFRPPSSSAGDCLRRLAREADCLDGLRRDLLSLATLVLS